MPYFDKPFGQYVQGKPADKFGMSELHGLLQSCLSIVFVAKTYRMGIYLYQLVIADGYFVGVSAKYSTTA